MALEILRKTSVADPSAETANACPACHGSDLRQWGVKTGYALHLCGQCGTIFTKVQDGDATITSLYDHYYDYTQFTIPDAVAASLERLAQSVEPYRRTGRWLDIGFGQGGLLGIAERLGWQSYGTEVSPQALEYGRRRGWTVTDNAGHDPQFPQQGFDVVTMIELLEHVSAPERFLLDAARLLRPGGLLYVTTPNAKSLNRRLLGAQWSIFSPPEHITIWTAKGLGHALSQAGFRLKKIRTQGLNPYEIIASVRKRNGQREVVDRGQTSLALNNTFSSSPTRRVLKAGINQCLSALRIGDGLKIWAVRDTGMSTEL